MTKFLRISVITAAALLASCAYGPSGGKVGKTGQVQVVDTDTLPEPGSLDITSQLRSYVIGAQDVLILDVLGLEDMAGREIVVDSAGRISVPLAGSIPAAGRTPEELAVAITESLRAHYMRNPIVSVNVKDMVSQVVTVDGQVVQPGLYPVLGDMRLTDAIASAKGMATYAKLDDVVLLRTVNGQNYAGIYNMAAIRRGNYPDPRVYPHDVVVVGDSTARRRFQDWLAVLPAITSPLIYLLSN
jgi:polysaccharide biosynthesis/export protein